MAQDDETAQAELIDHRDQIRDMMRERQRGVNARMIGITGADPVGCDGAVSGRGEGSNEIAVEKAPSRISGKQQHRPPGAIALVDISHVAAVYEDLVLRPRKERLQ